MLRLARTIARLLEIAPGSELALDLEIAPLAAAFTSLANTAGAEIAEEGMVGAGLVDLSKLPNPLVPMRVRELISRVLPGGTIVVVVANCSENAAAAAQQWGAIFDMVHVHGETVVELAETAEGAGEVKYMVLRGTRRTQPEREQVKALRGIAHGLEASILIGRDGLSQGLVDSAREALARHGLIKAKLTPRAKLDKEDSAEDLAWATGGKLIQRVGKTAVIYRPDVTLAPPGVRR